MQTSPREEEWAQIVRAHQGFLLRMCFLELRDEELARDAVQESFLKAWQHMDVFRAESQEKTWLARIALNVCHDMQRSKWFRHVDRRVTPEMLPQTDAPPQPEDLDFLCALGSLPDKLRRALILYYYEDMTVTQAASVLGISQSTMTYRLKRGREKLRAALRKRGITDV